jgi:hypothetical protein
MKHLREAFTNLFEGFKAYWDWMTTLEKLGFILAWIAIITGVSAIFLQISIFLRF